MGRLGAGLEREMEKPLIAGLALALATAAASPSDYELTTDPARLKADAVGEFVAQLSDPKKGHAAAARLARFGRSAVGPLLRALTDKNLQTRYYAAAALDVIGDPRGTRALLARLADENEHALVRKVAARAMGNAGHKAAARVLVRLARDGIAPESGASKDEAPGIVVDDEAFRYEVIRALAYIGAVEADEVLITSLSDGSARIRAAAAMGLGDGLVLAGLDHLRGALSDPDAAVAAAAAKALGRFSRRAAPAVGDLIRALERDEVHTRRACIGALVLATGWSFRTPDKWREWWERKQNPQGGNAKAAKEVEESFPLPAVDAREIFKSFRSGSSRRAEPGAAGRSGSAGAAPRGAEKRSRHSEGRTPPALRMPWEMDQAEESR